VIIKCPVPEVPLWVQIFAIEFIKEILEPKWDFTTRLLTASLRVK